MLFPAGPAYEKLLSRSKFWAQDNYLRSKREEHICIAKTCRRIPNHLIVEANQAKAKRLKKRFQVIQLGVLSVARIKGKFRKYEAD